MIEHVNILVPHCLELVFAISQLVAHFFVFLKSKCVILFEFRANTGIFSHFLHSRGQLFSQLVHFGLHFHILLLKFSLKQI